MKLLFIFTLLATAFAVHSKKALEIHVFKVGQSDSQLIVFPSGYSIMIDCGDRDTSGGSNTKHVAKRAEAILGKKKIDIFILSHFHFDHFGTKGKTGIWYLLEKKGFSVGKFLKRNVASYSGSKLSGCSKSTLKWKYVGQGVQTKFVCYAVSSKDKTKLSKVAENAHRCNDKQITPPDAGAKVTVLIRDALGVKSTDSGNKLYRNSMSAKTPVAENDFSVCVRLQYEQFVYSSCGDLSGYTYKAGDKKYHDVESSVAPMMGSVDVLNVNHHGSKSATNTKWCKTLTPTVSVISCGGGSLPSDRPLKNLKAVKSQIYTTGKNCGSNVKNYKEIIQMNDDVVITVPTGGKTFTEIGRAHV